MTAPGTTLVHDRVGLHYVTLRREESLRCLN